MGGGAWVAMLQVLALVGATIVGWAVAGVLLFRVADWLDIRRHRSHEARLDREYAGSRDGDGRWWPWEGDS